MTVTFGFPFFGVSPNLAEEKLKATSEDPMVSKSVAVQVDLGLPIHLITIQCGSSVALSWTGDYKLENKAKHLDSMHNYIKDLVLSQRLGVAKVHASLQLAEIDIDIVTSE
eukprot:gene32241-biopygen9723